MFFCHTARIAAILTLLVGVLQVAGGFGIASGALGPTEATVAKYFPGRTTGEMIDSGMLKVALALALGALAEIGLALRKRP